MASSELNRKNQTEKVEDTVNKLVRQYNKRRGNYSAEINGHRIDLEAEGRRGYTVYIDDEKAGDISDEEDLISARIFSYLYGSTQERFDQYLGSAPDISERDALFHLAAELVSEPRAIYPAQVSYKDHVFRIGTDGYADNAAKLFIDGDPVGSADHELNELADALYAYLGNERRPTGSEEPGSDGMGQGEHLDEDPEKDGDDGKAPGPDHQEEGPAQDGHDAAEQEADSNGPVSLNGHDVTHPYSRFHYSGMGDGISAYGFNIRGTVHKSAGEACEEYSYIKSCELNGQSITVAAVAYGRAGRGDAAQAMATLAAKGPVDYLVSVMERYDALKKKDSPFDHRGALYRALARTNRLLNENIDQYDLSSTDPAAGLTLAIYDGSILHYLNVGTGGVALYNKEGTHSNSFKEKAPAFIKDKFDDEGKYIKGAKVTVRTVKDVAAFALLSEGMYDRLIDPHAGMDEYEADHLFYGELSARTDDAVGDLLDRHVNEVLSEDPAMDMSLVLAVNQDMIRTIPRAPFDRAQYQKDVRRGREIDGISGAVRAFMERYRFDRDLFETDDTYTKGAGIYSMVAAGHMMQMTEFVSVKDGTPKMGCRIELDGRSLWDDRTPLKGLEDTIMHWLDQMESSGRTFRGDTERNEEMKAQSLKDRFPEEYSKRSGPEEDGQSRSAAEPEGPDPAFSGAGEDSGDPQTRAEKYIDALNSLCKRLRAIEDDMLASYREGNDSVASGRMNELKDTRRKLQDLRSLAAEQHIPFRFDASRGEYFLYGPGDIPEDADDPRSDEEIMEDADGARESADSLLKTFPPEFQEAVDEIVRSIDKISASYREEAVIATLKGRMGAIMDAIEACDDHIDREKDFAVKRRIRNYRDDLEERLEKISGQLEAVEKCVDSTFKSKVRYLLIHQFGLETGADKVFRDLIDKEVAVGALRRKLDDISDKHQAALKKSYNSIQDLCKQISKHENKIAETLRGMERAEKRGEGLYTFLSNIPFLKDLVKEPEAKWKKKADIINLKQLVRQKKEEVCRIASGYYDELQAKQMEIAAAKKIQAQFDPERISAESDPILREMALESLDLFKKDVLSAIISERGRRDLSSYSFELRGYEISFITNARFRDGTWDPGGWKYAIDGSPATENDVVRLIKTDIPGFSTYCNSMRDSLSIGPPPGRDGKHEDPKR